MEIDYEKAVREILERAAAEHGMTVEEYRRHCYEENINYAVATLGITPEEVVRQGLDKKPKFYIAAELEARQISKETGRTVSAQDVLDKFDRQNKS